MEGVLSYIRFALKRIVFLIVRICELFIFHNLKNDPPARLFHPARLLEDSGEYSMVFFTTFRLFLYKNQSDLPETRKIWECFAEETQQVQRRCIAKLRADVEVENRWLCTYKKKRYEGLEN